MNLPDAVPATRALLFWGMLVATIAISLFAAATSPLLAWREPVYIVAGFAGVVGLALILIQPLLAAGLLPGVPLLSGRRLHQWVGVLLVAAVVVHVAGLWITSPPDVIDALLFISPTPFAVWGVIAMWALFAAAALAAVRRRLRVRPRVWRVAHTTLAALIVLGTVIHALLIEGTMGLVSKTVLCVLAVIAFIKVVIDLKTWTVIRRRRS